jgi:hypothetical protein
MEEEASKNLARTALLIFFLVSLESHGKRVTGNYAECHRTGKEFIAERRSMQQVLLNNNQLLTETKYVVAIGQV